MVEVLYHYSDKAKFERIIKNPVAFIEKAQKFSQSVKQNETIPYTSGTFFTDLAPQNYTRAQIAKIVFQTEKRVKMSQTEYFVVIRHKGNVKQIEFNTHFYILPLSSTHKQVYVMGGLTDTYTKPEDVESLIKVGNRYLSRFEKARIIGARALQLSYGAPPLIDVQENLALIQLAELELKTRVLPVGIQRKLSYINPQPIPIQWLSDKDFIDQIDVTDDIEKFIKISKAK